jgi:hypothetical protein
MNPITYELAKERMADRLREAERHQLVQQAKAAARSQRAATGIGIGARERQTWWARLRGNATNVPNTSMTRPAR